MPRNRGSVSPETGRRRTFTGSNNQPGASMCAARLSVVSASTAAHIQRPHLNELDRSISSTHCRTALPRYPAAGQPFVVVVTIMICNTADRRLADDPAAVGFGQIASRASRTWLKQVRGVEWILIEIIKQVWQLTARQLDKPRYSARITGSHTHVLRL